MSKGIAARSEQAQGLLLERVHPPAGPPYLTIQEVAELARCAHKAVRRAIQAGKLPAFQPAHRLLVREPDARAWIESHEVCVARAAPSPAAPGTGRRSGHKPGSVAKLREMESNAAGRVGVA